MAICEFRSVRGRTESVSYVSTCAGERELSETEEFSLPEAVEVQTMQNKSFLSERQLI